MKNENLPPEEKLRWIDYLRFVMGYFVFLYKSGIKP
ncbi:hypothetical protein SAMN05421877_103160 [Sphingobacterium lactis]|uniref:Uncharacterized protein n=1 Tax=Sphingobacterium lactis TaxID=797291 RepID=A0A1H5VKP9_9SPHI|nr:hypothetical protein SAMN05421877_103160 [Sphingobacterium lactis]